MYFNRHIEAWLTVRFPVLGGRESLNVKRRQIISESSFLDTEDDLTDNNNELFQTDIHANDTSKS